MSGNLFVLMHYEALHMTYGGKQDILTSN